MPPPGFALAQPFPGATTCILVGRLPAGHGLDLGSYRAILWCVDSTAAKTPPRLPATATLDVVPVDPIEPGRLDAALTNLIRRDARRLPSVFMTTDATQNHFDSYQALLARIAPELESHHRARVTRQRDAFAWQKHLLKNLPAYAHRRLPAAWKDALRGLPAFVCGAGPSLDISAPQLSSQVPHGVVLAADSALRTLARHGIAADFTVSIDVAKHPDKCLPADNRSARVVLSAISPPEWTSALPTDRIFFTANRQITTDWLATLGIPQPPVSVAENCGVTALELARFLGCAPIYLFGLDLALTATQRHTTDADASIYAQSGFDASQQFPEVPGNYSEKVPTHAIGDWRALDARLAGWPTPLVFNVNDRGARLGNTALLHPAKFTVAAQSFDKASLLDRLAAPEPVDDVTLAVAFDQIRGVGRRERSTVVELRATLESGGPEAAAAAMRPLFAEKTLGRVMGGFALKLMPHLMPPIEGDKIFWRGLIDEFAELLQQAEQVR